MPAPSDVGAGAPLLIVNADDYGLTPGVSRGILEAHRDGIVTSTSVLAIAPAFEAWAPALQSTEGIGIGAHLALVGEDPPILSRAEIPTLLDRRGRLARSWRQLLPRLAAGRVDRGEIHLELSAQMQRLRSAGLALTHVDTHQHVHLWPGLTEVVLDVAAAHDIDAVRRITSARRTPLGAVVNRLGARFGRAAQRRAFRFPAAAAGLDEAGALTLPRLVEAVDRLRRSGAASAELAAHPGEADDPDRGRYRWRYDWSGELDALRDPAARATVERSGFRLGTFEDLAHP